MLGVSDQSHADPQHLGLLGSDQQLQDSRAGKNCPSPKGHWLGPLSEPMGSREKKVHLQGERRSSVLQCVFKVPGADPS